MSFEKYIAELRGYLKALQHLNGPKYNFGVKHFYFDGSVDSFIHNYDHGLPIIGSSLIEFNEIKTKIYDLVMNGMISLEKFPSKSHSERYKVLLLESINEYYGLASTTGNIDGIFHPLIEGPVYSLKMEGESELCNFFYLVKIKKYYVLTYLRKRA
jgi:hypothetical protein